MDCSLPDFTVLHYLLEFAQTHVIELVKPLFYNRKKKKLKEAKVGSCESQKERISDCWQFGGGGKYLVRVCGSHRARWTGREELPQRWRGWGIYLVEGKAGAAWLGRGRRKQQM